MDAVFRPALHFAERGDAWMRIMGKIKSDQGSKIRSRVWEWSVSEGVFLRESLRRSIEHSRIALECVEK
jgi:hypothetical protein